jgi:trimeric autotransporter adhesin
MKALKVILLFSSLCTPLGFYCFAQFGNFETNGSPDAPKQGAQAVNQVFYGPNSVAIDNTGGYYFSCSIKNSVYHVAADGRFRLVAGSGTGGFSGDGGMATEARLQFPRGLAIDSTGNLYIADRNNDRIRKVTPSGIITTVAGNGEGRAAADSWNRAGKTPEDNSSIGDGGKAIEARLKKPEGVAVDSSGNLYIADYGYFRVRKVTPTGIITTLAGNNQGGLGGDGGQATAAQLNGPNGVAVDSSGNIYIADTINNRIRKIAPDGVIKTVAGTGRTNYWQ